MRSSAWSSVADPVDWANDQLGRLVHAADRHLFAYGFTCPTCTERVRLRVGVQRRPHFAHYSHSPKPDCEEYHPSTYPAPIFRPAPPVKRLRSFQRLSLQGGIFLGREEGGRFSLQLKLPRFKDESTAEGELRIQSGLGLRMFVATQLLRTQFVRVSPQVPLVDVVGSADMEEAAAAIEQDMALFRASGNFFAGNESARLLSPEEPLEWGESYRLMTQRPLAPAPAEIDCELLASAGAKGWFIYELRLPLRQDSGAIEGLVSHFTGRAIRMARSRVYIVDPMPHHVDIDGAYVYPAPPERLLLRRSTGEESMEIEGSARSANTRMTDCGEWIEVRGLQQGDATVRQGGRLLVSLRVEDCPLFEPQGVEVSIGAETRRLFDSGFRAGLDKPSSTVVLQSPTNRVSDAIELDRTQWIQRGTQHVLVEGSHRPRIDAGNFGRITWKTFLIRSEATTNEEPAAVDFAARAWIEGLVGRAAGWTSVIQLREFWEHGQFARLGLLSRYPWLRPYIEMTSGMRKP